MTDKKSLGEFIRLKRIEKNYSQSELAEFLYVTDKAVSKWERGLSYPDITLIPDICRVLNISEHELITAATDTDTRKIKNEAKKFRIISNTWFWVPTISYLVALLTCFICNLAINHTLSWFFIVLTALICAYSFIPTFTSFFKSKKLLVFTITTFCSVCLLLFTCAVYTNTLFWCPIACVGTLMGYIQIFLPILLSKSKVSRYKFTISFTLTFILTILLLLIINLWHPFMLLPAVLITCYAFAPSILCTLICVFRFNAFLKTGICVTVGAFVYYFMEYVVNALFGCADPYDYQINFNNWKQYINGNILFISLIFLLFIGIIFIGVGIYRIHKGRKQVIK